MYHFTTKMRRITAGIMGLIMLVLVMFSACYIVVEAGHHCMGGDCQICTHIRQCANILQWNDNVAATYPAIILPFVAVVALAFVFADEIRQETLISKKVRLND